MTEEITMPTAPLDVEVVANWMRAIADAKPIKEGNRVVVTRDAQVEQLIVGAPDARRVLEFLLNKFVLTNLATAKLNKTLDLSEVKSFPTFEDFLDFLTMQVDGTDNSVKRVQAYIQSAPEAVRPFLTKLATKSYKTGVSVTTYNKLAKKFGFNTVPDFDVQLADNFGKLLEKYEKDVHAFSSKLAVGLKVKAPKLTFAGAVTATEKFDGVRCIVIKRDGEIKFMTRDGREIAGLSELSSEFSDLSFGDRVFDGELIYDVEANTDMRAEDVFRATMKIVGSKGEKKNLRYHIFDTLTSSERFFDMVSAVPYRERRQWLTDNQETLESQPHVSVVPELARFSIKSLTDVYPILTLAEQISSRGGEGIMLNYDDAKYEFKRTKTLLKVKQANESDGEIVDVFMGQGEFEGLLGGVVVRYKETTVRVGSGFSLEERQRYATNPEQLIGQMATYAFTTESHDADGNLSLRFPRFKALRLDKTPKDASYDN